MNHQRLRWNVHSVANVGLREQLNLYKRGFKIYDLLVPRSAQLLSHENVSSVNFAYLAVFQAL